MRHVRRQPAGPLRRHQPAALRRRHADGAARGIGELAAQMRVRGKGRAGGIVVGGDDHAARQVFVGIEQGIAHGPDSIAIGPPSKAGRRARFYDGFYVAVQCQARVAAGRQGGAIIMESVWQTLFTAWAMAPSRPGPARLVWRCACLRADRSLAGRRRVQLCVHGLPGLWRHAGRAGRLHDRRNRHGRARAGGRAGVRVVQPDRAFDGRHGDRADRRARARARARAGRRRARSLRRDTDGCGATGLV